MQQIAGLGQRQGFGYSMGSEVMASLEAGQAHHLRLSRGPSGKPKLSSILKSTKLAKTISTFADTSGVCAWGAVARETNTPIKDGVSIEWDKLFERVDGTLEEINAPCNCPHPECKKWETIAALIPHMNDEHNDSFHDIGVFLEKHDL